MLTTQSSDRHTLSNTNIHYRITNSCLGRLLVAATKNGLCAVCLGDDDIMLEAYLSQIFPNREIQVDQTDLAVWVDEIQAYLNGEKLELNLAVDIQGTNFQWIVWQALQAIPYGFTRSYKQIADIIGNPLAVRAVAQSCATNPVALVIPCHRVIRSNGDLGGYRWGLDRKYSLIQWEKERLAQSVVGRKY